MVSVMGIEEHRDWDSVDYTSTSKSGVFSRRISCGVLLLLLIKSKVEIPTIGLHLNQAQKVVNSVVMHAIIGIEKKKIFN